MLEAGYILRPPAHRPRPRTPQNFVVNAAEAQIISSLTDSDGGETATGVLLERVDTAFTAVFTVELAVNAYGHWCRCSVSPTRILTWTMAHTLTAARLCLALHTLHLVRQCRTPLPRSGALALLVPFPPAAQRLCALATAAPGNV